MYWNLLIAIQMKNKFLGTHGFLLYEILGKISGFVQQIFLKFPLNSLFNLFMCSIYSLIVNPSSTSFYKYVHLNLFMSFLVR